MEQRTSVMISAILFAVVVAGSIAYLLYSNPAGKEAVNASPTPTQEVTAELSVPAPEEVTVVTTPTPTPEFIPVETQEPAVAAAVTPSAPTGPAEWALTITLASIVFGGAGLVASTRRI